MEYELTRIFCVLWTDILIARVQNVLVHECRARRDLSEEADLDRLANLDTFALLHKDLPCVLAPVPTIQTGHPVLFGMVPFLEWLKGSHEVVSTCDTMGDHPLGDSRRDGSLDDRCDRVHWSNHLRLVLGRDVEPDLLEEIFRGTESTHHEDILQESYPS